MVKDDNELPIEKAEKSALKALDKRKNEASDVAKPFLNKEILVALIDVASKSQFDDSPLVMKQKIRKLIKSRIRKEA
jgi:hypothetical protein